MRKKIVGMAIFLLSVKTMPGTIQTNWEPGTSGSCRYSFLGRTRQAKGRGCYCLYHGNLGISENEKVAGVVIESGFNQLEIPFVVAGKNLSHLQALAHSRPHTCIVVDPGERGNAGYDRKSACAHLAPSFNQTGVKLKLMNALFNGKFCLTNQAGITGSGLEGLCQLAETPEEFRKAIARLFDIEYTTEQFLQRKEKLEKLYSTSTMRRSLYHGYTSIIPNLTALRFMVLAGNLLMTM